MKEEYVGKITLLPFGKFHARKISASVIPPVSLGANIKVHNHSDHSEMFLLENTGQTNVLSW